MDVQVIDLFSGAGGMSCGFMLANTKHVTYNLLGGLDIDPHSNATYERMLGRPALKLSAIDLLDEACLASALEAWGYTPSKPLILIGCAPCQGFSSHRKKDPRKDVRNDLIQVFAKIVQRLKPEVAVMENVPELLHVKHWKHFSAFRSALTGSGYTVRAKLHNAAEFGVPQERFRAVVLAARDETLAHMPVPTMGARAFRTVRDAIAHLPSLEAGQAYASDPMHITSKHRPKTIDLLRAIPADGGSRSALPENLVRPCHRTVDGFRDVYGRLWWDRPAVAITARCRTPSCGRFAHPEQHRGLSVREAALLQSFPDNWVFEGPFDDKFRQIGNAVPPRLAQAIAESLDRAWGSRIAPQSSEMSGDVISALKQSTSSTLGALKRKVRAQAAEAEAEA